MARYLYIGEVMALAERLGIPGHAQHAQAIYDNANALAQGVADKLGIITTDASMLDDESVMIPFAAASEGQTCPTELTGYDEDGDFDDPNARRLWTILSHTPAEPSDV